MNQTPYKKLAASLCIFFSCFLFGCSAVQGSSNELNRSVNDEFLSLLDMELKNRSVARTLTKKLAISTSEPDIHEFWLAYSKLEQESFRHFKPIAIEYGLSTETSLSSKGKTFVSNIAFSLFPKKMEKTILTAIGNYVPKLKRLYELSPSEHSHFFKWVVEQEIAQQQAFSLTIKGEYSKAASLLDNARKQLAE